MGLSNLLRVYRKRKSIHQYLTRLKPVLVRLYGKSDYYTPEQAKKAAEEAKLSMADLCYGLSIYCTPDDFAEYHTAHGEDCNYWEKRVEVAEYHFHGNVGSTQQDAASYSEAHVHSHAGADLSGSHQGGDFGGHHSGH